MDQTAGSGAVVAQIPSRFSEAPSLARRAIPARGRRISIGWGKAAHQKRRIDELTGNFR